MYHRSVKLHGTRSASELPDGGRRLRSGTGRACARWASRFRRRGRPARLVFVGFTSELLAWCGWASMTTGSST